jgi:sugar lactone lactonase YvrE/murein DD-endopeptidase MepM/ murein hydrolase activator NlpD
MAAFGWFLASRFWPVGSRRAAPPRWPVLVSTIAGGGAPGFANGVVSDALFSDPFGIAVDAAGNVFVTDAGDNNLVRKVAPTGEVTTLAGGDEGWLDATGRDARFNTPSGIAISPDGSLIVADTGNHAIRRVTPVGAVTTVAGGGLPGREDGSAVVARFDGPVGVAVAPDGTIFVADTYNDVIRKIALDGTVSTVAGGAQPGYRDGAGGEARFDTPSGIAANSRGILFVADTGNNLVRRIDARGEVTTLGAGRPGEPISTEPGVALWRPVGVAATTDEHVYVSDSLGRVVLFLPGGRSMVVAGSTAGFADGPGPRARLNGPAGLAVDTKAVVRMADGDNYLVRALTPPGVPRPARDVFLSALPRLSPDVLGFNHVPWPVDAQEGWHELTATLGEARGSFGGDGRERLHAGIDVHADEGTLVRAVHDEKVGRPIAATGYGELSEMVHVGLVSYVHVRVGRDRHDASLDPARFSVLYDENGAVTRVRVRRGTRFRVGDPVGTVNRFAHVHLGLGPRGAEANLLRFSLPEFGDHVPPTIPATGVWLVDEAGNRLKPRRGRIEVSGRVRIVVEAWDQVDRNERRRRLGVYSLGYEVLRRDGASASGSDGSRATIVFDRLPQTPGAGGLAYAEGSGITVYGNRATRFRYVVTNEVHDGEATEGWWNAGALAPGDYRVRIVAKDIAGNAATREIAVRVASQASETVPPRH